MRIVKLKGGLGNQMFQYAFARLLANKTNEEIKLDITSYTDKNNNAKNPAIFQFPLQLSAANQEEIDSMCILPNSVSSNGFRYKAKLIFEHLFNNQYCLETDRAFRDINQILKYRYYNGYWQSWRYVDEVFDILSNEYRLNYEISEQNKEVYDEIQKSHSVFVGIRRGDYLKESKHYGIFSNDYYIKAMKIIASQIDKPVFYIFSNDIEWVENNMNFSEFLCKYRTKDKVTNDFEELILMANCKHSIIVNSTYYWWGARLKDNENKIVIAPKKWFKDNKKIDIVPSNWIKI